MDIIVGISGASGVAIGVRAVQWLREQTDHRVHLIATRAARQIMRIEMGEAPDLGPAYEEDDFSSPLASSSFMADAMLVAPCSMKTLAGLVHGFQETLLIRAGDIMLKVRRPLVLMPRETPLSLPAAENMAAAIRAGAIVLPPMLAFYHGPQSVQDMVDFSVGKALDALGVPNGLYKRWAQP